MAKGNEFARSLRAQHQGGGRVEPPVVVKPLRSGGPTMNVPGGGKVCLSPGRQDDGRQSRSAAQFAKPMSRFGGPSTTGE
jgi:hypothetical protein